MPELPEVETVKENLKKRLINTKINDVKVLYNKGVLSMVGAKSIILKICDNSKGHFDINTCSFLKLRWLQRYSNESEWISL